MIHCSLNNLKPIFGTSWSSLAINTFLNETKSRIVAIQLKSKVESKYNVEVYLRALNISDLLVRQNLAVHEDVQAINTEKITFKQSIKQLDSFNSTSVTVTSIYSPYCFYVQEASQDFQDFEAKLQNFYESKPSTDVTWELIHPQIGQMCVAKFSEDQNWYRATVKEIDYDQNSICVFFVDYGNEDVLPIQGKDVNVCEIASEFRQFPAMALKCSLTDIKPIAESKIPLTEIIDFMFFELGNRVWAKFIGASEDFYYVDIDYEKKFADESTKLVNLKALLVEKKYAHFAISGESPTKKGRHSRLNSLNRSQLETIVQCKSGNE